MADNDKDIDGLGIKIEADAKDASQKINQLANSMLKLSQSLGVDTHKLSNIATSIRQMSDAATGFKGGKSAEIASLARSLMKFSDVDTNSIYGISSALQSLASGMSSAQNINASGITSLVNAISKLGGIKSTAGTDNLLRMKDQLVQFVQGMNTVGGVTFDATGLSDLIQAVSRLGTGMSTSATANLPIISAQLQNFIRQMNNIGSVGFDTSQLTSLISAISRLGSVASGRAITNIPQLANAIRGLMTSLSTAPQVSNNLIQMVNAIANLASQGGKAGTAARRVQSGLDKVSTSAATAQKKTVSLAQAFGKLYANFFWVIRGAKKLWSSIESTTDYIEAFNYFAVSFGKIGSEWGDEFAKYGYDNATEYAESFTSRVNDKLGKLSGLSVDMDAGLLVESGAKNLGLNIQEITQYASQLASVTNSLGQTGETTTAIAKSMTMLAGDISSLFNVDYETVANNIQSGLIGQSKAMYKYGTDLTNATLQTYAYNLGVSKSITEMSQMEKQQLRVIALLDQSKVSWGDLANTINSPSNMIRQLTTNLKETGMVMGQLFIPVLQKVLPVVNGVTIAIKRLLVNVASLLGIKVDFESFGQSGYKAETDAVDDVTDSYDKATAAAKKWQNQLMGFDEINKLTEQSDAGKSSSSTPSGAIDLTDEILKATEAYEKVWNKAFADMDNDAQKWADRISKFTAPFEKMVEDIKIGDYFTLGQDVSKLVRGIFDFFSRAIAKVDWYKIGNNIGDFLAGLDWPKILKSALKLQFNIWKMIADLWFGSFQSAPFETAIITAFAVMKFTGLGSTLTKNLKTGITAALSNTGLARATTTGAQNLGYILGDGIVQGLTSPLMLIPAAFAALMLKMNSDVQKGMKQYTDRVEYLHADRVTSEVKKMVEETTSYVEEVMSNSQSRMEEYSQVDTSYKALDTLADSYLELAQKEQLTNEEQAKMQMYHDALIEEAPELQSILDDQNLSYEDLAKNLKGYIAQLKKKAKTEAAQKALTKTYEDMYDTQKKLNDMEDEYSSKRKAWLDTAAEMREYNKQYYDAKKRADELLMSGSQADWEKANNEAIRIQKLRDSAEEAWLTADQNYQEINGAYTELQTTYKQLMSDEDYYTNEYVANATEQSDATAKATNSINANLKNMKNTTASVMYSMHNNINETKNKFATMGNSLPGANTFIGKKLKEMATLVHSSAITISGYFGETFNYNGFVSYGKNIWNGLKKGLEDNKAVSGAVNTVKSVGTTIKNTFSKILGIHSPSKVFEQYGEYTIDGYNLGVENQMSTTQKIIDKWANGITYTATPQIDTSGISYMPSTIDTGALKSSVGVDISADIENAAYSGMTRAIQTSSIQVGVDFEPNEMGTFKVVKKGAERFVAETGLSPFPI